MLMFKFCSCCMTCRHDNFLCNTLTGVDLVSLAGVFNSVLRESDESTKINDKFN